MNNETIKIESVNKYIGKLKKVIIIAIVVAIIGIVVGSICQEKGTENWKKGAKIEFDIFSTIVDENKEEYKKYMSNASMYYNIASIGMGTGVISGSIAIVLIIFYFVTKEIKIVVTDKRVYGKTIFGKQVDLPFDSISAIAKSWFKGVSVATSSGKIVFLLISNNEEIYQTITELLIERQGGIREQNKMVINPISNADELKKYKELLDSGVITEDEFNAKKKQLLGL